MPHPTRRALGLALAACLLSACSAVYKPAPFWGAGGYSSTDLDASTVSVNYLTGATADADTARDYALYRCAEIALERGFDGFVVLKGGAFSTSGPYGTTTSATITMRMFKGAAPDRSALPAGAQGVYVARVVKARLERGRSRQLHRHPRRHHQYHLDSPRRSTAPGRIPHQHPGPDCRAQHRQRPGYRHLQLQHPGGPDRWR